MQVRRRTLTIVALCVISASKMHAQVAFPIILDYSTYLPPSDGFRQNKETAIASVDSSGSACVTDGNHLWIYDAAGNPTLVVASLASVGLTAQAVFRDTNGNCFVAGNGSTPSPGDTSFGTSSFAVAKLGPTGMRAFTTFFGGSGSTASVGDTISGLAVDPLGNIYVVGTTSSANFPRITPCKTSFRGGLRGSF